MVANFATAWTYKSQTLVQGENAKEPCADHLSWSYGGKGRGLNSWRQ